ncbi:LSU ribosomal protein L11P [Murinocardiopsis flavida]|uniref:Large ribosomal subunit protein uL11 n=1 Tax=Murinocardiopsis flavida TaxID=645275 RepID=A0A2P8DE23_9ACTN|nr:50S ribosomal protein L11 [Murinocardiopsis flavida]PSK95476.1 LSU ribosomal protein L11P [Murinocardiopsis flavida]
MATAQRVVFETTLNLNAGDAAVADLGKTLGATGINLIEVKRAYDASTAAHRGETIPAHITVYENRTFALRLKTPPTAHLIRGAIGTTGSAEPGRTTAGTLTRADLRAIAERKLPDLNVTDIDAAMRTIAGTARSMGVAISDT